jgi:Nif-specific regulatory protein
VDRRRPTPFLGDGGSFALLVICVQSARNIVDNEVDYRDCVVKFRAPELGFDHPFHPMGLAGSAVPGGTASTAYEMEPRGRDLDESGMVGASRAIRRVQQEIAQVARSTATVLVLGESGTGKELVARAIHASSERAREPFVEINGAAFPDGLFESELFGYERGAFTGAVGQKKGRLDLAQGGTLFLDEVGELPLATQVKLLRVLQSREFERLGGTEKLRADVRLIAATNRDIDAAVASGVFREDLYYRLNVFTITLPPLRDRRDDIEALVDYFLRKYSAAHGRGVTRMEDAASDALRRYDWPGNVRELENAVERAVVACDGSLVEERHLPASVLTPGSRRLQRGRTLASAVEQLEVRMIREALRQTQDRIEHAARELGTTQRVLRYKMKKYGLAQPRARRTVSGVLRHDVTGRDPGRRGTARPSRVR